jgi:hypothetical protein
MRYFRYSACFLLTLAAVSLYYPVSVRCQQTTPDKQPATASAPAPKADPKATGMVTQLVDQLEPRKAGWIDTQLWQHATIQGADLVGEGRCLFGPGAYLRTDVKLKLGTFEASLLTICDGTTVWNQTEMGKGIKHVEKWDPATIKAALETPGTPAQFVEIYFTRETFFGFGPLLQSIKQQMVFTHQEPGRWQNREVAKVTGVWAPDLTKGLNPNAPWPLLLPRKCFLLLGTLEGKMLWPYRIEWWGPVALRGEDVLLFEMEFRNPRIAKPDSKEATELLQECRFSPGNLPVVDRTKDRIEQLNQMRMRQQQAQTPNAGVEPGK